MSAEGERPRRKLRWGQFSLRALLFCMLGCALLFWWLQPEKLDRGYFPIGVGYKWVYASQNQEMPDDVVFEVVGREQIGDADCFVVVRSIGEHEIKFYVEVTHGGAWIHQVGEDRYQPPYRQFAFPTAEGDRWDWKGKTGAEPQEYSCWNYGLHEVTVPLGQWEAFEVVQWSGSGSFTNFSLADGVGVIQIFAKTWDEHDPDHPHGGKPVEFDWQLKEFTRP